MIDKTTPKTGFNELELSFKVFSWQQDWIPKSKLLPYQFSTLVLPSEVKVLVLQKNVPNDWHIIIIIIYNIIDIIIIWYQGVRGILLSIEV